MVFCFAAPKGFVIGDMMYNDRLDLWMVSFELSSTMMMMQLNRGGLFTAGRATIDNTNFTSIATTTEAKKPPTTRHHEQIALGIKTRDRKGQAR